MKRNGFDRLEVGALLQEYVSYALAHSEAISVGDHKRANAAYDGIVKIYRELRRRGEENQKLLLGLLDHSSESVKGWAAAHALEFAPECGEPVLESLSDVHGFWGLNAKMTLQEWRKGRLIFP